MRTRCAPTFSPSTRSGRTSWTPLEPVETGLGLFLNDVAPEDAARQLSGLDVPAEPIELDALFTVTQPDAAMLS